jgi:acetaldehyde dehydrogenase
MTMTETKKVKAAIIGSGNIGTDLMIKLMRRSKSIEVVAMVGIDPASDGLARAALLGIAAIDTGIEGLLAFESFDEIEVVFDATSAKAHLANEAALRPHGKLVIDLTPAAVGPYVVPSVNLDQTVEAPNLNMVTCGGQATIPIVAAVSRVAPVLYAEIVASVSSKSAGPGTRANIDEFTETTAKAIVDVGGAKHGKAIIILNPAEPPMIMRDTIYCLAQTDDKEAVRKSIEAMIARVQTYVPGYSLKQEVQFEHIGGNAPLRIPGIAEAATGLKVSVFLEVEGAGHYLPIYAGNLDIMTSAAIETAENILMRRQTARAA